MQVGIALMVGDLFSHKLSIPLSLSLPHTHSLIDPPGQSKCISDEQRIQISELGKKMIVLKSDLETFFQKYTLFTRYLGGKGVIKINHPKIVIF